jgi:putative ABC transport system ATP-binding protein
MIELKDISKIYDSGVETRALSGVSLDISRGEFTAIIGPSGSGKSTLMHIIGLLDKPSEGNYLLEKEEVFKLSDEKLALLRNQKLGFVFQTFNLLPRSSALENVMLPLVYSGMKERQRKEKAAKALESVNLGHKLGSRPNQLSGGEQQRVAIARAIINEPEIIMADEPTGNLDSASGGQIMQILQRLNKEGHTVILVTHEKYTAEHAERLISLKDGKLVSDSKVSKRIVADGRLEK